MGIFLFAFFLVISLTGLLLGWKKNIDYLQTPTQKGVAKDVSAWLPMDTLIANANLALEKKWGRKLSTEIDKLDARPDKGIIKVIYKNHYNSLQIDAATGEVLSYESRTSDFIEQLHDGSYIDDLFGLPGGIFKLFYTALLGLALTAFAVTGFWLWYGPKVMRKLS